MKNFKYNILSLVSVLIATLGLMTSCSDDNTGSDDTVQYGVASEWICGSPATTRATLDPPPAAVVNYVYVDAQPIPGYASLSEQELYIYPSSQAVDDNANYRQFHTDDPVSNISSKIVVKDIDHYEYTAKAISGSVMPDELKAPWTTDDIPLFGNTDYLLAEGTDNVKVSSPHVLFTLQHQTAIVRFVLGIGSSYDKLRTFKLKSLKACQIDEHNDTSVIASASIEGGEEVLTTSGKQYLSFHVYPGHSYFSTYGTVKIFAKYDVYDKSGQLTRKDCTASNAYKFSSLSSGYYYNILVTLAPDFLYVLSDNDDKSDLVLK